MTEVNEVNIVFKKNKIIPDVLTKAPEQFLKVAYPGNLQVDKGNELTPTQVKNAPTAEWNVEDAVLYTLLMIDPDAPSRKNPTFREYQHWLVVNIPGSAIDKGDVLTAYVGSGPPKGTGLHRYIFLLYKQMGKLKFSEFSGLLFSLFCIRLCFLAAPDCFAAKSSYTFIHITIGASNYNTTLAVSSMTKLVLIEE